MHKPLRPNPTAAILPTSRADSLGEPSVLARSRMMPVAGSACSQKNWNDRCDRSSRKRSSSSVSRYGGDCGCARSRAPRAVHAFASSTSRPPNAQAISRAIVRVLPDMIAIDGSRRRNVAWSLPTALSETGTGKSPCSRSTSSAGTERGRGVIAASTTRSSPPTGTKAGRSTKDIARPGLSSLERVTQAQLEAPRAAIHDATGLTELRVHVGCRRLESLEARIVRVVEDIECLGRQRGALEVSELEDLFEPQVDGPEREIVIGTARVVQDGELAERETPRSVRDRVPEPRADGQEAADHEVGGQPEDAR